MRQDRMTDEERDAMHARRFEEGHARQVAEMALAERAADLERRGAALAAAEAEQKRLAAPMTETEAAELSEARTMAWLRKNFGDDYSKVADMDDKQFTRALASVPKDGWPSGDTSTHLRELRKAAAPIAETLAPPLGATGFLPPLT